MTQRWLNIGAGRADNPDLDGLGEEVVFTRLDGNADTNPDVVHDFRQPFPESLHGMFDGVFASHTLEHVSWREVLIVLENIRAVLKPGGVLFVVVPDIEWASHQIMRGNYNFAVLGALYGAQVDEWDYHRCGFTPDSLGLALQRAGYNVRGVAREQYKVIMYGVDEYAAREIRVTAEVAG